MPQHPSLSNADSPGRGERARWLLLAGLLVGLAVVGAFPAAADLWYQHYQKAREAMEREDWESAVGELNQAIERRGDSGARVRTYGMRTTDYFPYLELGIAYLNLGQPEAALQAFETEERLGAVEKAAEARELLASYREDARAAIKERDAEDRQRIEQILRDSLERAGELARRGQVDEAMVALGRGLAVAPEDSEANELMERLRRDKRQLEVQRELEDQVAVLVEEGSELQANGELEEAASHFRQALGLRPGDVVISDLLQEAQAQLRAELRQETVAGELVPAVDESLDKIARLRSEGRYDEALAMLQPLLVIEPDSAAARELEERLVSEREKALRERADSEAVAKELTAASEHYVAGRFEEALSAANRALVYEPGNVEALDVVSRSYREISRVLFGRNLGGEIPPAIRFADFRQQDDDGTLVQIVRQPEFRLTGMVIDNSPVDVSFNDSKDRELPVEIGLQQLGDFYLTEFQLDVELQPGRETLRVVATDVVDLSASSEYEVFYQRSRLRSPWFVGLLAALPIGISAVAAVRRSRRLARRRRRRFNPYVAGAPVLDERLFFGRAPLIDRILQTIHNNSLLLYGERRIGKTSIQHHLKQRLLELDDPIYEFFPIYVDLQGTTEDRFFATIAEDVFQQLGAQVDLPESPGFEDEHTDYSYRDLVRDLRHVIRQLSQRSKKKVKLVLLIDEVDELNDYDPRINQRLRSLFMKSFAESLVAVVSGVEIKRHWERVGSPWYNFFEEIEVLPLEEEEARQLIEKPIAGVLKVGEGVVERILEVTGRRPYLIQRICVSMVHRAYERGSPVITLEDVESVAQGAVS